jgi:phenylacetate-CoA ligase
MSSSAIQRGQITVDAWRTARATRDAIDRRQRRRLAELLHDARRQSRFYKAHYEGVPRGDPDLTRYPPVTKPMLMDAFDDVVTDPAITRAAIDAFIADESRIGTRFLDRYPVWTTSGTTGDPGVFVHDDASLTVLNVLPDRWLFPALLAPRLLSRLVRHQFRGVEIAVTGGHFAGASGVELLRRESPFLADRLRILDPTRPLSELFGELNEFQPAYLIGYASVLRELGAAQREGRLHISPALVVPTAEPIAERGKASLARNFGCLVREAYGATECYPIAVECGHGRLHVNSDWVALEPVDADYRPVAPGEPSTTVLVTNLANRVMPLIRYDLGDSVTLHESPCPCGSAFPTMSVEGRQGDVLRFDTDTGEVPVFPLALSTVVEEVPGVRRTQLVQTGPSSLSVRLETRPGRDEAVVWGRVKHALESFFAEQGVDDVTVELAAERPHRHPTSGKFRHVWSEV